MKENDDNMGTSLLASMRVSRRGARLTAASLKVTAGASLLFGEIISGTPGARCEIYAESLTGRPADSFIRKYYELTR